MSKMIFPAMVFVLAFAMNASAGTVGAPNPLSLGESVDGWSGISVMDGAGAIAAGESVSAFSYYAADRAAGNHFVQPLVAKNDGTTWTIFDVGPVSTAAPGLNTGAWSGATIPSDGSTYAAGFWQWNAGVDDTDGGIVTFAGAGGAGMFQENEDATSYVPAVGDEIVSGHASGADGRAYQFNVNTVPEPSSLVLALLAGLGITAIARRK